MNETEIKSAKSFMGLVSFIVFAWTVITTIIFFVGAYSLPTVSIWLPLVLLIAYVLHLAQVRAIVTEELNNTVESDIEYAVHNIINVSDTTGTRH